MPLFCDANTGWRIHEALQVVNGVKDLDVYIEQPCLTYEECLSVRKRCPLPFIIDESMDDIGVMTNIIAQKAADAVNLKISKVGGLSKARAIRDLAVSSGIALNIEDTWYEFFFLIFTLCFRHDNVSIFDFALILFRGGDIVTAAITHLAHSTPPKLLLCR